MAAVAARERKVIEQARNALVENGVVVATGLVTERGGDPALADAGGTADQQVGMIVDPAALGEPGEQCAVEPPRRAVVDVLDAGLLAQLGVAQAGGEPLVVSQRRLPFEQHGEPFGMAEAFGIAGSLDIGEGLGHAVQAEHTRKANPAQPLPTAPAASRSLAIRRHGGGQPLHC